MDENSNSIINDGSECNIVISIISKKTQFSIKFSKPNINNVFSDDYYLHFKIKGKNNLEEQWILLDKVQNQKTDYYVTPFNLLIKEVDYKSISYKIDKLEFYYINKEGKIINRYKYEKKYQFFLFK